MSVIAIVLLRYTKKIVSLFSCFVMGKRGGKRGRNQITGKRIDGGATKESPSKLSPIKVEAAANNNSKSDVGGEPFEVKHRKKRSRSLTTEGVEYGGEKDSASGDDDEPVIKPSFDPEEVEKNDNRSPKDYKKAETVEWDRLECGCFSMPVGKEEFYDCNLADESSLKDELIKIKTFDLRGGDGGKGGRNGGDTNGGDTNGGVSGQGGGAGGVAN